LAWQPVGWRETAPTRGEVSLDNHASQEVLAWGYVNNLNSSMTERRETVNGCGHEG